jgi:hypothetical protein
VSFKGCAPPLSCVYHAENVAQKTYSLLSRSNNFGVTLVDIN